MCTIEDEKKVRYAAHHMRCAISAASMSHAKRNKVGCVIVRESRPVVDGWNGRLPGGPNICEAKILSCSCGREINVLDLWNVDQVDEHVMIHKCKCGKVIDTLEEFNANVRIVTRDDVLHAEENAILFAAKKGVPLEGCSIYCTHSPCIKCARMIIAAGIKECYYIEEYRDFSGVNLLLDYDVHVMQVSDI